MKYELINSIISHSISHSIIIPSKRFALTSQTDDYLQSVIFSFLLILVHKLLVIFFGTLSFSRKIVHFVGLSSN